MRTLLVACCCFLTAGGHAAPINLCSGKLCFTFDESDSYAPSILTYGDHSISPGHSADGFVIRMPINGVKTYFGAALGRDWVQWQRTLPGELFSRLTKLAPSHEAAGTWLAQGVSPIAGGFEIKQFVAPGPLASEVDLVFGMLMNFDARFTDWRAYNSAGELLQSITADPTLSAQRLGGSQGVKTIQAFDYERELMLIVQNDFDVASRPYWYLVPEGVASKHGNRLSASLTDRVRSDGFYTANWSIRVAPFSAAVPEPSAAGIAMLATVCAALASRRRRASESPTEQRTQLG